MASLSDLAQAYASSPVEKAWGKVARRRAVKAAKRVELYLHQYSTEIGESRVNVRRSVET